MIARQLCEYMFAVADSYSHPNRDVCMHAASKASAKAPTTCPVPAFTDMHGARLRLDAGQGFERLRLWEVPWGRLGALAVVCLRAPVLVFFLVCASSVPSVVLGACAGNVGFVVLVIAWARCIQGLSVSSLSSEALRQAAATE